MTTLLLHQVKARYNYYKYSSFYKPTHFFTSSVLFVTLKMKRPNCYLTVLLDEA